MRTIYESRNYSAFMVVARYAKYSKARKAYLVHEVNGASQTLRTVQVEAEDLPPDVVKECDRLTGYAFCQVKLSSDWRINNV